MRAETQEKIFFKSVQNAVKCVKLTDILSGGGANVSDKSGSRVTVGHLLPWTFTTVLCFLHLWIMTPTVNSWSPKALEKSFVTFPKVLVATKLVSCLFLNFFWSGASYFHQHNVIWPGIDSWNWTKRMWLIKVNRWFTKGSNYIFTQGQVESDSFVPFINEIPTQNPFFAFTQVTFKCGKKSQTKPSLRL